MQIYRYNDYVAISPPAGPTFYLTAEEARKVWNAINDVSQDIEFGLPFSHSKVSTFDIEADGTKGGS